MTAPSNSRFASNLRMRHFRGAVFAVTCGGAIAAGVAMLGVLLYDVFSDGMQYLNWEFLQNFPSRFPEKAGIKSALWGTVWVMGLTAALALPLGVGAAIYLEEFAAKGKIKSILDINMANLAGVPSIVFGILGLAVFVRGIGLGPSVLAGALTMSLLALPIVVLAAREAVRAVPNSIRLAALAVGATRWQTVWHHVLPAALPGILTGVILSMSRVIGETAPLIMMGALTYVAFVPESINDPFTVLPIQVFNWASRPQKEFHLVAASGIVVLLAVLLTMNAAAIFIRYRFQRYRKS
jgi:phosphate transport system permease protein